MTVAAAISSALESVNPATGEVVTRIEPTPVTALPAVVARARAVQREWAGQPLSSRCGLLQRLSEVMFERRGEIADLVTRESGKPRVEALFADVLVSLDAARYFAEHAEALLRSEIVPHHNLAMKAKRGRLHYEPYGVIGMISPWNYPLAIPMGQAITAVVAGNAVVMKPSELTPCCGALVGELFAQAGFPADLVQIIQGRGEVGKAFVEAAPDKIIFTGSVATGRRVAEACAGKLIPCVLELGGKDAMIVLDDADIEVASSAAVWGSFTNCGQACLSVERIYVVQEIAEKFTERCVAKTKLLKVGPGTEPDTEVGPMIRAAQVDRMEEILSDAVSRGARILAGGHRLPELGPCFFEPTVVTDVTHSMRLMQEETFGPMLALRTVANEEEAVRMANDSPFGLSASIWTSDNVRGRKLAAQVRAGAVMINDVASYYGIAEAPHGGCGASGWGKTHSRFGLLELVQAKYVDEDRLPGWPKSWWYGYNRELGEAADRFLQFLFAPQFQRRWRSARGAIRAVFRGHRI
jgi:succinate-semialdehyde dehydrogenase/glutarate-semialdehyde dehydrogenase